jgi:hypothetical protein
MKQDDSDIEPMHEPLAQLERELVAAFVAGTGYTVDTLRARDDAEAHKILAEASLYASARLSEVEARLHYLRAIRGEV